MIRVVLWTIGIFVVLALVIGALGGWLSVVEVVVLGLVSVGLAVLLVRRRPRRKAT